MDLLSLVATPVVAYLAVVAFVALDSLFPAFPAEIAVVSSGALSAAGHLNLWWAVSAAAVGAVAGDHVVYALGRHQLPGILDRSRIGRRIHAAVDRTHDRLGASSSTAIIAARFIPLGRTAGASAAGLAGIPARRFLAFSMIGSTAWALWLVGTGYLTGSVTDAPLWQQVGIGVVAALVVGVWVAAVQKLIHTRRQLSARASGTVGPSRPAAPTPEDDDPPLALSCAGTGSTVRDR